MKDIKGFIENWNISLPDYHITSDDLNKPTAFFFIEALLKVLESCDIQTDRILREKPQEGSMIPEEHHVLGNLVAATNFLLSKMDVNSTGFIIKIFDLLMPTPGVVQSTLMLLHNFATFIHTRKADLIEKERQIEDFSKDVENVIKEIDQYKIEIDEKSLEAIELEKKIKRKEEKLSVLKQDVKDKEVEVNELKTLVDYDRAKMDKIEESILHEKSLRNTLEEQVIKLKSQILTESEQAEVMYAKESMIEQNQELKLNLDDINQKLWMKDANIKTFTSVQINLTECQMLLENLEELSKKMKDVCSYHSATNEEERELRRLQEHNTVLSDRLIEYEASFQQLQQQREGLLSEIKIESNLVSKEEKALSLQLKQDDILISKSENLVKEIQTATIEYNKEYERLLLLYTEEIPALYDSTIKYNVNSVNKILTDLEYVYEKNL